MQHQVSQVHDEGHIPPVEEPELAQNTTQTPAPEGSSGEPISAAVPKVAEPTIFDFIRLAQWEAVIDALEKDPKAATLKEVDDLPLHVALATKAPIVVIESLLNAYPGATKLVGHNDLLPIHYASALQDHDYVSLILKNYPHGAAAKDSMGNLALHYAAFSESPIQVFEDLIKAFPEATRQRNNDGELPAEIVFRNKDFRNMEVVNYLLDTAWKNAGGSILPC